MACVGCNLPTFFWHQKMVETSKANRFTEMCISRRLQTEVLGNWSEYLPAKDSSEFISSQVPVSCSNFCVY